MVSIGTIVIAYSKPLRKILRNGFDSGKSIKNSSLKDEEYKMEHTSIKKNTVFNAIKTLSSIVFPLITFPYISRTLLAENIGKINFGSSIVSYFTLIATLGITTYAIRECSAIRKDKLKLSDMASQIFTINVITTIIAYITLLFTLIFCHRLDGYRTLIIIQSLSIITTTVGADWLNSAMEDFRYITIRTVFFQILSLIFMFMFIHSPEDYMKYAVISLFSSAGASVTNIWYRRKYCEVRFIWYIKNGIDWKKHIMPIIDMFVMILAQTIFNSVDSTMLGLIHGDREVGIYSAAHKIMNIINQVVASLVWVIMPRMSSYFAEKNYEEINKLLRKVLNFYVTLGLPCAIGTIMLSNDIILVIFGTDFADASSVLRVMMIGFIFSLYGGNFLGNTILLPSKKEKTYMIACCVMAVFNVMANYILIPRFRAVGAAITTAMCSLLMLIMLELKKDKKIYIKNIWGVFLSPIIGCILIVIICILGKKIKLFWGRMIFNIGISIISYFAIQIILKNSIILENVYSLLKKVE